VCKINTQAETAVSERHFVN